MEGFTKEEIGQARELFALCDKNKDGSISLDELAGVMQELGVAASKKDVDALFQKLSKNGENISFDEFLHGLQWLNKAMVLSNTLSATSAPQGDAELKKRVEELEKRNEILHSYLLDFVSKSIQRAERECNANHHKNAALILELVDYPLVRQMEGFLGGKITNPKLDEKFVNIQQHLTRKK